MKNEKYEQWCFVPMDEPFAYDVPEDDITRFHRFADCQHYYSPRDEVLCYFVLSMRDYATRKEARCQSV